MTVLPPCVCLKVDVDTHDGMRDGVPRLLDAFRASGFRATFFLSFGPDNAGKAILNVLRRRGFLRKMLRTGAPSLYGWRTIVSGTLLPARPIATAFPDTVRRIADEGHEVGVHAWDHRLWQDHLHELDRAAIVEQFARSFEAHDRILGCRAQAVAAPAWFATAASLAVQDTLGLQYASDVRGGAPGYPVLDGYRSTTLQIPTTQPSLDELLSLGERDVRRCLRMMLDPEPAFEARVLPLHAEVEGGAHAGFLQALLAELAATGVAVRPLRDVARDHLALRPLPRGFRATLREVPGRAGSVFVPDVSESSRV